MRIGIIDQVLSPAAKLLRMILDFPREDGAMVPAMPKPKPPTLFEEAAMLTSLEATTSWDGEGLPPAPPRLQWVEITTKGEDGRRFILVPAPPENPRPCAAPNTSDAAHGG